MASILFVLEVVAFVVVVWWAYVRSEPGAQGQETGLLGMRSGERRVRPRRAPRWKTAAPQGMTQQPDPAKALRPRRPEPQWKTSGPSPRPPT
jgi:hypothetical protein